MEQKFKLLIFINISLFILLTWIYHSDDDVSEPYKSPDENCKHSNKLNIRNYRLLSKCKHNNDTFIVSLNEVNSNNRMNEKKDIYSNEQIYAELKRKPNRSSSNNMEFSKKGKKNKSCIFETKKYSRMEKKIFKELNYLDFLKNNRTIRNNTYQKIIRKKYGFRITLPILFVLLLCILLILDLFDGCGLIRGLFKLLNIIATKVVSPTTDGVKPLQKMLRPLHEWLKNSSFGSFFKSAPKVARNGASTNIDKHYYITGFFGFLIYFIPIFIIGVTCILGIFYYHKKVKKYEKIKFSKG
ncbi:fam-l protein [Plasmodium malariae]|uniref:Fam-l protein n=1 Tax=Plasmodium malariae TaxID=5858 RepID=A0A1D3JHF6_PLAMA|nr:fam-l protein [Plasmodium malariae]SBT85817.1 fam-l protein [Plasmodium malariae]